LDLPVTFCQAVFTTDYHYSLLNFDRMNDTRDSRTEKLVLFEQFIDQYYPSIFAGVQKLTGPAEQMAIEKLTVEIFVDLWENSDELFAPLRKPAFVYKILVRHVVSFLTKNGNEEQLRLLQHTLFIDPTGLQDR
jgi:DNA-directed RNA polymerase specialized sigma24 family protein